MSPIMSTSTYGNDPRLYHVLFDFCAMVFVQFTVPKLARGVPPLPKGRSLIHGLSVTKWPHCLVCGSRQSDTRRDTDGLRDDKEDAEDPPEKAQRLESVPPARPVPDRDPRAAGPFSTKPGTSMVDSSIFAPMARAPYQFSRWGGVRLVDADHHLSHASRIAAIRKPETVGYWPVVDPDEAAGPRAREGGAVGGVDLVGVAIYGIRAAER